MVLTKKKLPMNPVDAFNAAIKSGALSDNPSDSNYAGLYMYMGNEGSLMLFKHINTREYLKVN